MVSLGQIWDSVGIWHTSWSGGPDIKNNPAGEAWVHYALHNIVINLLVSTWGRLGVTLNYSWRSSCHMRINLIIDHAPHLEGLLVPINEGLLIGFSFIWTKSNKNMNQCHKPQLHRINRLFKLSRSCIDLHCFCTILHLTHKCTTDAKEPVWPCGQLE